jgi:AP-1-like transcription factor
MSSLDENDFLLLLQKQFPPVNAAPIDPGVLAKAKPDMAADPQSLSKFQLPNSNSPLSTDSSPSPPSANDDNASFNGSDGINNTSAGQSKQASPPVEEDHHKRKASADDFDDEINGQPSAKSQHTDPKSKKIIHNRRKSGGAEKGQVTSGALSYEATLNPVCRMRPDY